MKLKLSEITRVIDGELFGNPNALITGASPIKDAGPSDITFISHPRFEKFVETTHAGCIVAEKKYGTQKNFIIVKNPLESFIKILEIISDEKEERTSGIHPSAAISKDAKLGKNVSIGAYAVICDGVSVGDDTSIMAGCYIGTASSIGKECRFFPSVVVYDRCVIGDRVMIHSGSVIGSDGFGYIKSGPLNKKIPQVGIVKIGDDVEIGSNTSIDKATLGTTEIGNGTKIDNLVQIAHNVKIGKNCLIASQTGIAGSTSVGDGVTMAGQVGISGHLNIGDGAIIGAQAGVIGDVKPNEVVSGYPARPHMKAMRLYALIEKLPEIYRKVSGK